MFPFGPGTTDTVPRFQLDEAGEGICNQNLYFQNEIYLLPDKYDNLLFLLSSSSLLSFPPNRDSKLMSPVQQRASSWRHCVEEEVSDGVL